MKAKNNHTVTTVTLLTREQIDFLDKLGKDYRFRYGHNLSRGKILSELVNLLIHLGIGIKDIDLRNKALWEGIKRAIDHEERISL